MSKPRVFTAAEKVVILKKHLCEKVPVSDLCDQYKIHVNTFYPLELRAKATSQTPYDAALDLGQRLGIELPTLTQETGTGKRNP